MNTLEKLQAIKLGNQDFWKVYESFNASEHDISEADIPSLLEIVANQDLFDSKEEEDWLSHSLAIKSLRQFKSAAGFKLLIELAKKQEDPDFLTEEIFAFSKEFRYEGYGLLKAEFLAIEGKNDILGFLAGGIKESVKDSESIQKEEAAQVIASKLKQYQQLDDSTNALLVSSIMSLGFGEQHYELIKEVYKAGLADIMVCGDLEDIEIELGMRTERETERKDPFAFMREGLLNFEKKIKKQNLRKTLSNAASRKVPKLKKKKKK